MSVLFEKVENGEFLDQSNAHRGALRQRSSVHLEAVGKGARHAGHDRQVHATTAPAVIGPPGEAA